jgi:hypothetical protein
MDPFHDPGPGPLTAQGAGPWGRHLSAIPLPPPPALPLQMPGDSPNWFLERVEVVHTRGGRHAGGAALGVEVASQGYRLPALR